MFDEEEQDNDDDDEIDLLNIFGLANPVSSSTPITFEEFINNIPIVDIMADEPMLVDEEQLSSPWTLDDVKQKQQQEQLAMELEDMANVNIEQLFQPWLLI